MVLQHQREKVKDLLRETITVLCRNGLDYKDEFSVEALIGITLDKDDVFLVNIKETIQTSRSETSDDHYYSETSDSQKSVKSRKRRRKKKCYDREKSSNDVTQVEKSTVLNEEISTKQHGVDSANHDNILKVDLSMSESTNRADNEQEKPEGKEVSDIPTISPIVHNPLNPQGRTAIVNNLQVPVPAQLITIPPNCSELIAEELDPKKDRNESVVCPLCQKRLSRRRNLKPHLNLHRGVYPYYCSICNKGFSSKTSLRTHMKIHQENPEGVQEASESSSKSRNETMSIESQNHSYDNKCYDSLHAQYLENGNSQNANFSPLISRPEYQDQQFSGRECTLNDHDMPTDLRVLKKISTSSATNTPGDEQNGMNRTFYGVRIEEDRKYDNYGNFHNYQATDYTCR